MKRDLDLARKILLAIEEDEKATGRGLVSIRIEDCSEEQISYHVKLLHEAGLIEAIDRSGGARFCWEAKNITWDGHEFLDSARNETLWRKAKEELKKTGNLSFQILGEMLLSLARNQLISWKN